MIVRRQPLNELLAVLSAFLWPNDFGFAELRRRTANNIIQLKKIITFIPMIVKYAIQNSNDNIGTSDRNKEEFYLDLNRGIDLINEIKDWYPVKSEENIDFYLESWRFVIANQQLPQQENPKNLVSRFILLYKIILNEIEFNLNLDDACVNFSNLNLDRLWTISLKTLVGSYSGAWITFNNFQGLNVPPFNITNQELNDFFNYISTDYLTFRKVSKDEDISLTGDSAQFYGFNPLDKYPAIRNQNKLLILSPYYFIKRINHSIYYDFLDHFQNGEDPRQNQFSTDFGKIFELYIGKQLTDLNDGSNLITEFEFGPENKKFSDYSLLYGNDLCLIEVKKNLLPQKIKFSMDKAQLKQALEIGIIRGLVQCSNKTKSIISQEIGLETFSNVENIYPLVIIFDESYMLNDGFIRDIINEILIEKEITLNKTWQIITTRELEDIVNICSAECRFIDLLKDKLSSPKSLKQDWTEFIKSKDLEIGENRLLQETFTQYIAYINHQNI